ncbi:type I glyceraldehyde-3-phosphate dehydrogenase [Algicola sagamiensis]|uniref:type I glyceraldehyde-3-phosphate dehydrogenase n=1 Tax=Algicola sagamiensis TaxID=163869 RepID=UPI00035F353E|nr:type I glyceraldehyde-3-phosphate dehydrogenase [Algicola sagamiensis]
MTIRVAINGFGRIGRNIVRALYESAIDYDLKIVAINDLGDSAINAHLLKYDTAHGQFGASVEHDDTHLYVNGDPIRTLSQKDPAQLPWKELEVDLVMECTGLFTSKEKASLHIQAGAKKVLISAPGKAVDATVVHGVNHDEITSDMTVISNASCTTNCLAPVVKPLNDTIGIESGLMTTIHAYTNDQRLNDVYHTDVRRARAAASSMIPTKTGAAAAVGLVVPELAGKLDGLAVRVPTLNVSLVDLCFIAKRDTSVEEINEVMKKASESTGLSGILAYNTEPLVSVDFNHNPHSSIFDASETRVSGRLVKVMAWYDNEWGFSNRMLDNAVELMK